MSGGGGVVLYNRCCIRFSTICPFLFQPPHQVLPMRVWRWYSAECWCYSQTWNTNTKHRRGRDFFSFPLIGSCFWRVKSTRWPLWRAAPKKSRRSPFVFLQTHLRSISFCPSTAIYDDGPKMPLVGSQWLFKITRAQFFFFCVGLFHFVPSDDVKAESRVTCLFFFVHSLNRFRSR